MKKSVPMYKSVQISCLSTFSLFLLASVQTVFAAEPPASGVGAKAKETAKSTANKTAPGDATIQSKSTTANNTAASPSQKNAAAAKKPESSPNASTAKTKSASASATKTAATKTATTSSSKSSSAVIKSSSVKAYSRTVKPRRSSSSITSKVSATVNSDGTPIWLDVRSAQAAAKAKKKMIIADYFTDWCGWCKVLDKRTLSSPEVQAYLARNFVCMKVNAQDGAAGEELAKQFDVRGFPTIMIFASNGRKLASFDGFREPQDFLAAIKEGLGPRAPK